MSEVEKVVEEAVLENEEVIVAEVPAEEIEYSEVEQEAMAQGWSPEGAEGKRNLTAEEYLDRKPLYDKLHKQGKQIKKLDEKFEAMQKHEGMVRDRMHEDHVKELETAKRTAYEEMDFDKADEISNEIVEAKVEHAKADEPVINIQEDVQATLEEWVGENSWYKENDFLQRQAEKEGKVYRLDNPNASFEDVLDHISKTVKKDFPEKFQNMNRQKPSTVEGGAQGARRKPATPKKKTVKDLPEEAIPVMKTLIQAGAFKTQDDYVNDYFNQ
jgi:hypothetical protein